MSEETEKKRQLEDHFVRYVISPELTDAMRARRDSPRDDDRRRAKVARDDHDRFKVIIEVRNDYPGGRRKAQERIAYLLSETVRPDGRDLIKPLDSSASFVFASLDREEIERLLRRDSRTDEGRGSPVTVDGDAAPPPAAIFKVWPDHKLEPFLDRSVRLIKADACHRTFEARGQGIVWAVVDSGIEGGHPHFDAYDNLNLGHLQTGQGDLLDHCDFTPGGGAPLVDAFGHGTHVAGILGGATPVGPKAWKLVRERDQRGAIKASMQEMKGSLTGVAPAVTLVSLKVLDDSGEGEESSLISALEHIAKVNNNGERLRIHGVNISLGYPFLYPEWFAAGRSPICMQVNRLVDQGVVVVVAAGNDGSAFIKTEGVQRRVGLDQSIADPGNAEKAITVGSTHAEEPFRYGVSYFSSKGPTADGRMKPDLLAPGERILSCASRPNFVRQALEDTGTEPPAALIQNAALFKQDTGTSMAAPHVSGAIAAFMSARSELIGEPALIKRILMDSASDLGRKRDFQGSGLIDLMRAMQAQTLRKDLRND
jgi:serine protease AprX